MRYKVLVHAIFLFIKQLVIMIMIMIMIRQLLDHSLQSYIASLEVEVAIHNYK
jgi:hypothetical protein